MDTGLRAALADRYRIDGELGHGGMATVYLAYDLRHHREVALKVLRPELSASLGPDRFLREIEIAAQLTHPHILPIHDSGEVAGTLFYVMPHVEGESLRDRLARERQLSLEEALQVAREVADALGYAHAHGVVHRDIKPENILFQAGHALVADFGVARAVSAVGGERLTETGFALGTPAYMSPEQAAGSAQLDARSDLYSLGCVLYEMLSGETPYTGPTAQAILAKKLSEPLPRIRVVREAVPPGLEAVLRKVLAKTPADRYASAAQFAAALAHPEAAPPRLTRKRRIVLLTGSVVVLAALGGLVARLLSERAPGITVTEITPVTSDRGREFQPAISPNGDLVAYVAGSVDLPHLFVRSTVNAGGGRAVRLGHDSLGSEWLPAWSRDGSVVRFLGCPGSFDPRCSWLETGTLGGTARPFVAPASRLAWSPDGRIALVRADTIFTTSRSDSAAQLVAVHAVGYFSLHSLAWSPDGRWIAYVNGNQQWRTTANTGSSSIWVVNAAGGIPVPVLSDQYLNTSPAWLDASHLLFVSDRAGPRAVYVIEVGPGGAAGRPRMVAGIADPHTISYSAASRKLAFSRLTLRQNVWVYPLAGTGQLSLRAGRPLTTGNQYIESFDVSRDGGWLAYDNNLRGNTDLYRKPLEGGEESLLTDLPGNEWGPRWSPDGSEIAFYAVRQGFPDIMVMPAVGGAASALTDDPRDDAIPMWAPDGRAIAFQSDRTGRREIWLLARDDAGPAWRPARQLTDFGCEILAWAPDGSGVLCQQPADGQLVLVSPAGRVLWRLDLAARGLTVRGDFMAFSPDRRTLYGKALHRDGRVGIWAVPMARGEPRLVVAFDDPSLTSSTGAPLVVTRDRLYLNLAEYEADIWVAKLNY